MNTLREFERILSRAIPVADDIDVLASWEVPFNEVAQIVAAGRLPTAMTELGRDGAWAYDSWIQALWIQQLIHLPLPDRPRNVQLLVRAHSNRASYEILMIRRKPQVPA